MQGSTGFGPVFSQKKTVKGVRPASTANKDVRQNYDGFSQQPSGSQPKFPSNYGSFKPKVQAATNQRPTSNDSAKKNIYLLNYQGNVSII